MPQKHRRCRQDSPCTSRRSAGGELNPGGPPPTGDDQGVALSNLRFSFLLHVGLAAACGSGSVGGGNGSSDTTPPAVVSTLPAAGATNVSTNATVTVRFSEELDASTVGSTTIFLDQGVGADVALQGAVVRLTPRAPLALDTTYTATVSTGIKDAAGNALAANFTWSFSTGSTVSNVATLTWEAPTTDADGVTPLRDLAGYKIYSGTTSRTDSTFSAYDDVLDAGNSPICAIGGSGNLECIHVLQGFAAGATVYFTVTAYDTSSNESDFSNEASKSF